jgi:hypothetical protein
VRILDFSFEDRAEHGQEMALESVARVNLGVPEGRGRVDRQNRVLLSFAYGHILNCLIVGLAHDRAPMWPL